MFRYLNTDTELFSRRRFETVPDTELIGFADHCINKLGGTAAYLQKVTETIFTDYLTKP